MIALRSPIRQIERKLQPEHLEGLIRDRSHHNRQVLTTISVFSLLSAVALLIQHGLSPDAAAPVGSTPWLTYATIYAVALLASAIVLILGLRARRWAPSRTYRFSQIVAVLFVLTFVALSLADSATDTETAALILGMVVAASSFRASGRFYLFFILLAPTVFLTGHTMLFGYPSAAPALTVAIAAVFGVYIALTMEGQRVEAFLAQGELVQQNKILAHLSATDPLTGVMNRRTMNDNLTVYFEKYRRYGARCSVIMLDIDHFKAINDRFGHATGDDILIEIARKLNADVRISDEVARYGGEEFAVLLPHTHVQTALDVAERIRDSVESIEIPNRKISVTASLGVEEIRAQDEEPNDVLRRADIALYRAKEAGRNLVFAYHSPGES